MNHISDPERKEKVLQYRQQCILVDSCKGVDEPKIKKKRDGHDDDDDGHDSKGTSGKASLVRSRGRFRSAMSSK